MTPTHESQFDSVDLMVFRRFAEAPPKHHRFRCARGILVRIGVLCLAGLVISGVMTEAAFAAPANGRPTEALRGPWRWLVPDLDGLRPTSRLAVGPWREVALTLDPDRRQMALVQLEQDPQEDRSGAARIGVRAAILQRAALEWARLLEAAGESVAAAEAYGPKER